MRPKFDTGCSQKMMSRPTPAFSPASPPATSTAGRTTSKRTRPRRPVTCSATESAVC